MRHFLNAYIEVNQKVPDILPMVYKIMEEHGWEEERRLFFLEDINDLEEENRTSHAMLRKAFPELTKYWHTLDSKWKWQGYFNNFPGYIDGKVVFMPEDKAVTRGFLADVASKIPRPCTFYQASLVLDGIRWFEDCNTEPEMDWRATRHYPNGNINPGEMIIDYFQDDTMFYQSNCILLDKLFDMRPALIIRIELTKEHSREEALGIVKKFQAVFGTPDKTYTKIFTISVSPWEGQEQLQKCQEGMQKWYNRWCEKTMSQLREKVKNRLTVVQVEKKTTTIPTLQKRVVKALGLGRYEIRPWDDRGWGRRLDHNFWLYVEIFAKPAEPGYYDYEIGISNCLRIYCYGDNFNLFDEIHMRDLVKAPWNVMAGIAFECYEEYLKQFEEDVVPKLAEVFGNTDNAFYQESYEFDHYWQDNLLGGWMDVKRCAKEFIG